MNLKLLVEIDEQTNYSGRRVLDSPNTNIINNNKRVHALSF